MLMIAWTLLPGPLKSKMSAASRGDALLCPSYPQPRSVLCLLTLAWVIFCWRYSHTLANGRWEEPYSGKVSICQKVNKTSETRLEILRKELRKREKKSPLDVFPFSLLTLLVKRPRLALHVTPESFPQCLLYIQSKRYYLPFNSLVIMRGKVAEDWWKYILWRRWAAENPRGCGLSVWAAGVWDKKEEEEKKSIHCIEAAWSWLAWRCRRHWSASDNWWQRER